MASIKLNSTDLNGELKRVIYNGNEVKAVKGTAYIATHASIPLIYNIVLQGATSIGGTTWYIWAVTNMPSGPSIFFASSSKLPANGYSLYSATFNGTWSVSSDSGFYFIPNPQPINLFSEFRLILQRINSILFSDTGTGKKYINFGTIATKSIVAGANDIYLPNKDDGSKVIDFLNTSGILNSHPLNQVIGWGYRLKYPDDLNTSLAPTNTERLINKTLFAENKFIASVLGVQTLYSGGSLNIGVQTKLYTIKDIYATLAAGSYLLRLAMGSGNVKIAETFTFTVNLANQSELPASAKLCFAFKVTTGSYEPHITTPVKFNVGGDYVFLQVGEVSKTKIIEIDNIKSVSQKTITVNIDPTYDVFYQLNWMFRIEITPFVIS